MKPSIFVYDEFQPEDTAMLQALYSRSAQSVAAHADRVTQSGSGKFMETYYIGYNHKSIGDCGSTTLFLEGVSELVAKAFQDWQLYCGQQTSTRYIDFTQQPLHDPIGSEQSGAILEAWMSFYRESLEPLTAHLRGLYPKRDGESEKIYDKAIQARSFDILRAFLPAAVTTQLSWHTNLRQAWDKLSLLVHHPLAEVRATAEAVLQKLQERYPNSFTYKLYEKQEQYRQQSVAEFSYFFPEDPAEFAFKTTIKSASLAQYERVLSSRPIKTELPLFLEELGQVTFDFMLDFGSFRDLQRHRHGVCRMPLLSTDLGFENWYLEQLPAELREKAEALLKVQADKIEALTVSPEVQQYYCALGYRVACRVTYGLPAAVYVVELRSGATVHPTLRTVAHRMDKALRKAFPMLMMHSDLSADAFSVDRGTQDISVRKSS